MITVDKSGGGSLTLTRTDSTQGLALKLTIDFKFKYHSRCYYQLADVNKIKNNSEKAPLERGR